MKKITQILSFLILSAFVIATGCKKPGESLSGGSDKKDNTLSAVVVFSVGESKITHSDSTEEKAVLGVSMKPGDKIITGDKAKVDIQIGDGSTVRLSGNTKMDFNKLALNDNGTADTQLALVSGKVFAKVNKAQKNDNFSVVTPTAIAGVRGTSFIMENGNGKVATVKVLDGQVALAPRVPALENISSEDISKSAELTKLKESLAKEEVVIEKNQSSSIASDDKNLSKKDLDEKSISSVTNTVEKEDLKVTKADTTKNEEQEIKTMVTVDPKVAKEMVHLNEESNGKVDDAKAAQIDAERKKLEDQVAKQQDIEKKKFNDSIIEAPKKLDSKQEIVKYYERIEKIIMTNGSTEVGAIINQEGSTMIVHTESGIKRINQNDVQEVIYDFQSKGKF